MKKHILYSMGFLFAASVLTGCSENAWNDHLDGFESGFSYTDKVTVSYTLSNSDYETIGKALVKVASTNEETLAAQAIQANHYFDQSSPYPAQVALPYLFDDTSSDYFIYNNGSVVEATFRQADATPEELSKISSAYTYTITSATEESDLPTLLKQKYPDASEGEYAIVSYLDAANAAPATYSAPAPKVAQKAAAPTSVATRSSAVWTVSEALFNMSEGFEGEAVVIGVISSIDDLSTSYGNATYYIKDNLSDEAALEIYRGYYIDGEKFISEDQLAVGATVVVSGKLVVYNGTYEFNSGSKIISYFPGSESTGSDNLTDNIKDLTVGDVLSATAVVTAQCTRGLVLTDNAGSILYYNTAVDLSAYPIGTVVEVSGEVSAYNKGFQLSNTAAIEAIETMVYNYPAPVEYTGEMVTAACSGTENMTAQYVSIEGVVSFSGNYINIAIPGTDVQGSAYYITDDLKSELVAGSNYKFYGYFTSFTGSYFYIVVTGFEEIIPDVDPYDLTNAAFYYDGSSWEAAENVVVVSPKAYKQMGFSNNDLSDPEIYLPLYLKTALPYALSGDEVYVAYNLKTNSASCDLLVYDGSAWTLNNNNLETVTASFTKTDGIWQFTKYLGKAVFSLFVEDQIALDRTYLMVSGDYCANPVLATNSYGYLLTTGITISGNSITMANENNGFQFLSSVTLADGTVVKAPAGYFVIKDSNERYLYLQGTYSSFNVTDNPANVASGGAIGEGYLFSATKLDNGAWMINNNRGEGNVRNIYFSSKYTNFAAYTDQSADDSFPFLYILPAE